MTVTQPESQQAAAPENLAALLAECGLQHHGMRSTAPREGLLRGERVGQLDLLTVPAKRQSLYSAFGEFVQHFRIA